MEQHRAAQAALQNSSGFGAKMMASMGWSVGKGLGKDESGRVNIVSVTKREEGQGLGVGVADTADDAIKAHKNSFASIASQIVVPSDSDSDVDSSDDSSDDEGDVEVLIKAQAGNCATEEELALLRACGGRGAGGGQGGHGGAMARIGKLRRVQADEGRGEGGTAAEIARSGEIARDENGCIIVPERPKTEHKRRRKKKLKGARKDKKQKKLKKEKKGKKEKARGAKRTREGGEGEGKERRKKKKAGKKSKKEKQQPQ